MPIVVTVSFLGLQALLYAGLAPVLGIAGLSWATVAVGWAQFALLLAIVARREGLDLAALARHGLTVWALGAVAVGAGWALATVLITPTDLVGHLVVVAIGGRAAAGVYGVGGWLFGLPELRALGRRVRR